MMMIYQPKFANTRFMALLLLIILSIVFSTIQSVDGASLAAGQSSDHRASSSVNQSMMLGAVVGILSSLVVLGLMVFTCMDCMNTEVSSESHPACKDNNPKWGGAVNYHKAGSGEGYVSEVIDPANLRNAPLPYSMVPTQIPEAAEFRGYQSGGAAGGDGYNRTSSTGGSYGHAGYGAGYGANPSQLAGYQESDANASSAPRQGRHYNPAVEEDHPPTYTEAIR